MFLLQLDLYVRWESLEGRPHTYLKYVSGRSETTVPSNSVKKDFYSSLNFTNADIDFKLENNKIKVVDNTKFENFLKFAGESEAAYPIFIQSYFCVKDEQGNYYNKRNIPTNFPETLLSKKADLDKISWYFRGELIEFKVKYQTEEQKAYNLSRPTFINKNLKEYAKARIEQTIKTQRFRSHIFEKLSEINNTTKNI
jgi:hypothetical protein